MSDIGIFAAALFAYGLVSRRLERLSVSAPMVFVAAGIAVGPDVLGLTSLELSGGTGLVLAEVALVVVLFTDAARIDPAALLENRGLPARLLGIGMPLAMALGTAAGALLLPGIEFWEAAMVAAVLVPTDAALGQAVVSSERLPGRIRQALNVESGLNDGLAIPFLFLFTGLAVSETEVHATGWAGFALQQIGIGALVGAGVGLGGGWLVDRSNLRGWDTPAFGQISMLALAVGAWALAGELGGNGFIAAFAAGLAAGRVAKSHSERILDFTEEEGRLLDLAVFFLFGASAIGFLGGAGWEVVLYGALSLTVVRMLPTAIALAGSALRPASIAFVAWFGPRGLASIILALVVLEEEPGLPGGATLLAAMTVTVLASVVAHGASARPLTRAYAARMAGAGAEEAEMLPSIEVPVRGSIQVPVEPREPEEQEPLPG